MPTLPIAQRCHDIDASGIRNVFELAEKKRRADDGKFIDLSIGQPDFPVPDPIKQAALQAIRDDHNAYTVTQGIRPLREKIARAHADRYGTTPDAVMITSGVSGGLLLSLLATCGPGDEAIILDPYFVMYKHLVTLTAATGVVVGTYDNFALPVDAIVRAITPRTKVILLNAPGNPTGCVYDENDLKRLADLAEKHNLLVISDEIYGGLWYDKPPASIVRFIPHRTVLLDGFSKSLALTGWRVGFAVGPKPIIEQMSKLQQYTFVCAPSFAQYAALEFDRCDLAHVREDYRQRRDLVYNGLKTDFEIVKPGGGFYLFPRSPVQPATRFVELALDHNVLIIPGNVFSDQDTHFRISYARPEPQLAQAVEILCTLAQSCGNTP